MQVEYRLILKRNDDSILEDTVIIDDFPDMEKTGAFEKKIRDYIRGLNI